ncbi:cytochrome b562 [Salmonella enterica]|uniref:cytochrome b562 n=1 Tax=Salmonella enterica TaxID=28901 RepID=UPI0009AE5BB0|nr:cytochrome b562 [Salmonella enterica]EBV4595314.1 cytochrome b562 [Salmonella enterica subsp. enterica serovar Eastbourne]EBV8440990.1 cytochrome b562 [Salmonella enterica subsp. enterica serovar Chester]EBX8913821.1 cytochrome b562 [Salmonella enterica subsp. enterica serovar Agoueve]EBX9282965.1 cytochrome b562 [Salmonella enterica subsp. enterica serovar Gaminara]ECA7285493.1 cytochrome b562 [Salmonella enterica subsp. enterica serovar Schwarzengrund]ECF7044499.1 cytochrome b562 [Salmon
MFRKIISSAALLTVLLSSTAFADLKDNMQTLSRNLNVVEASQDGNEILNALDEMKSAALKSRDEIPDSLEGKDNKSPEWHDYQKGYDSLIVTIDKARKLVLDGNVSEAKKLVNELKETRNSWHKKYR